MKELICLAGIPGAGKSTYAEKIGHYVVSSDRVRNDLYGDQECYYNEEVAGFLVKSRNVSTASLNSAEIKIIKETLCKDYVFEEARRKVRDLLRSGRSVVYDSTNLMAKFRRQVLCDAEGLYTVCELHYLNTPLETALVRNKNRKYMIAPELIREMFRTQQFPSYEEGFDHIYEVLGDSEIRYLKKDTVICSAHVNMETQ